MAYGIRADLDPHCSGESAVVVGTLTVTVGVAAAAVGVAAGGIAAAVVRVAAAAVRLSIDGRCRCITSCAGFHADSPTIRLAFTSTRPPPHL